MINMGIISGDDTASKTLKLAQTINDLKVIGLSAGHNELTEKMLYFQAEELINSSQAIYFDRIIPSFDMIKHAVRKRNNLYFNRYPRLSEIELKQLINLSHEASSTVQFFVPQVFQPDNFRKLAEITSPFLANIRMKSEPGIDEERQLFQLLLFVVVVSNSEFRKTDLMTIPNPDGSNLLECRIVFSSGSVARILFSNQIKEAESQIEFFQSGKDVVYFNNGEGSEITILNSEKIAIQQFSAEINQKKSVSVGFSHLLQAQRILSNLQAKMNYSGGFSSGSRYAV
ncbi:hypothetical protein [Mangrovibacterium diazotrophicum]|uniref:Uncharacterized protein n=1 Tax=Mangrovibacterium diazotrophicum TaxID=1261403 RepID=A0A419WBD4_9BACT|nr:hypothetical protein [Mangrovibacterium diazotrophicum]RKD92768.1 hypothetical protein BC643_3145 [Mangrovibacterium diazotrophicum]